jgi:predicted dithiol-disulfide oxidoreductase (DUF899 family)
MDIHPVVTRDAWLAARRELLVKEKEATRFRDTVNAARMALPWMRVDTPYLFDTPEGARRLADLFDGRSQLVVYHFMLGPGWSAGCKSCSLVADHFDGALVHLNNHDVTMIAVSRAPLPEIEAYKRRMGWRFPWVSSFGSTFNSDYHVSFSADELSEGSVDYNFTKIDAARANDELPGLSVFSRNAAGELFHTYSCYARGLEELVGAFMILDRAPKGRNETTIMDWVRRHDEYAESPTTRAC